MSNERATEQYIQYLERKEKDGDKTQKMGTSG